MAGKRKPKGRSGSPAKAAAERGDTVVKRPSAAAEQRLKDATEKPVTAVSATLETGSHAGRGENNFDLLRLIAASMVVFGHCWLVLGDEPPLFTGESFTDWGNFGVLIFFAISGFLVSRSWVADPRLLAFAVKRFLRIVPGLIVALLFTAFVIGPLVTTQSLSEYLQSPFTKGFVLNNSVMWTQQSLPGVFEDNAIKLVNLPLWTLAPEVKAYVLVAVLGVLGLYRRWSGVVVVAAGVFFALLLIESTRNGIPLGDRTVAMIYNTQATAKDVEAVSNGSAFAYAQLFAAFFISAALFTLRRWIPLRWELVGLAAVIVAIAAIADAHSGRIAFTWLLPYIVLVVAYRTHHLFALPARMGDLSYGIYIYAFPIQQAIVQWVDPPSGWVVLLLTAPVVVGLAAASWRFVEAPALTLKQRIVPVLDDAGSAARHPDPRESLAPAAP
jgi:peptidoglycan/LPS O-acetylase OafA/YrhL